METPTNRFKCVAVFIPFALAASGALANNESRFKAYDISDGVFEIVADTSDNSIYWCGAGTHALKVLGKQNSQKIFVIAEPSGSVATAKKTAAKFGFTQPAETGPVSSFSNDVDIVGNSMTVAFARQFCFDTLPSSG